MTLVAVALRSALKPSIIAFAVLFLAVGLFTVTLPIFS